MYLIMWPTPPTPEYILDAIANWKIALSVAFLANPVTSDISLSQTRIAGALGRFFLIFLPNRRLQNVPTRRLNRLVGDWSPISKSNASFYVFVNPAAPRVLISHCHYFLPYAKYSEQ
jgi:hypothetical protein